MKGVSRKGRVLVVDDDELIAAMLVRALRAEGMDVESVSDPSLVLGVARRLSPDAVLLDVNLPGKSGLDVLQEVLGEGIDAQVVMLTADDSAETAVRAMKAGATDYLTKPFNLDEVKIVVQKAIERRQLRGEIDYLRRVSAEITERPIVGVSPAIVGLKEDAARFAEAGINTILITGESGTGKEMFARLTHQFVYGAQREGYAPFVGVNCAALPENLVESELFGHERGAFTDAKTEKKGVFEFASGGSLLLDEIGEMPMFLQSKLLRVLEERHFRRVGGRADIPVEAVVFATTNRNLEKAVGEGTFRRDLFYRLNAFTLHIPPLRDRREDVAVLVRHFLERFVARYKRTGPTEVNADAERLLLGYDWPGNVRELRNVVERIVVLGRGPRVLPEHLPREIGSPEPAPTGTAERRSGEYMLPEDGISLEDLERQLIVQALERAGGNKTVAAKLLHMTYDSLRYQVKKYGLE